MIKRVALFLGLMLITANTLALDPFTISDIRVEGLQRISEGTVFSYLPLDKGDIASSATVRSSIRELYQTGFFDEIKFVRENDILVIQVVERPAIANISLSGNKAIKDEDMFRALMDIGLAEGEVFDRQVLDKVQQELVNQYFSQGRYAATVEARTTELDRNRVRIAIVIDEGDTAEIRHINIVGNTIFSDEEIREGFESDIPPRWKFWSKDDQYSREKLSGDLEKIRSYYQDRGYVDANVESTQVSISPDKQEIYITANVTEGEIYSMDEVQVTGDLVVEDATIRRLILTQSGQVFSRKRMEQSVENITALLSNIGYAFANVNPIPTIDRDARTVTINYFIEPGKRVYIRRVTFTGNSKTKDEVLRREMRQFEGAWFSQAAIDRSKVRLQRLTYFDEVEIETPRVPGSIDQVDVVVSVVERPAGSFSVGLGFSQVQGLIASLNLQQDNFLGSGKRVGFGLSHSDIISSFNLTYDNPFWTDEGISRGFFLRYQEFDQGAANISTFTSSEFGLGMNFGAPITEVDFVRAGMSYRQTDINIGGFRSDFFRLIDPEGDPSDPDNIECVDANNSGICPDTVLVPTQNDPLSNSMDQDGNGILDDDEREFSAIEGNITWSRDTLNHFLNPTRGSRQVLTFEASIPSSTREYYKVLR
jgi:outer membrane protein insertion porin family